VPGVPEGALGDTPATASRRSLTPKEAAGARKGLVISQDEGPRRAISTVPLGLSRVIPVTASLLIRTRCFASSARWAWGRSTAKM